MSRAAEVTDTVPDFRTVRQGGLVSKHASAPSRPDQAAMSRRARVAPRGAHAAPSNRVAPGRRLPAGRHGQPSPLPRIVLPALLLGLFVSGFLLAGTVPGAPVEQPLAAASPMLVTLRTNPVASFATQTDAEQAELRASRGRPLVTEPSPVPTPAASATPTARPAPVLPGCSGEKPTGRFSANGQLPASALCRLPGSGQKLRADAAVAFVVMSADYKKAMGSPLCITDSYRTLAQQQALARQKPGLTARPGRSEHGWGLAADLSCGVESFGSRQHAWMRANAPSYGWTLPTWARRGGSKPEPWHWEYTR